jgi:hypothetical protein
MVHSSWFIVHGEGRRQKAFMQKAEVFYLLLATCYLLLAIYYSLLITHYFSPAPLPPFYPLLTDVAKGTASSNKNS